MIEQMYSCYAFLIGSIRHRGHGFITRTDSHRGHASFLATLHNAFSVTATENGCQRWCELQQENCDCTAKERWVIKHTHWSTRTDFVAQIRMMMMSCPYLQDNVIFERLNETSQYKDLTIAHLEQFATEGLKIFMHPYSFIFDSTLIVRVIYTVCVFVIAGRFTDSVLCVRRSGGEHVSRVAEGV